MHRNWRATLTVNLSPWHTHPGNVTHHIPLPSHSILTYNIMRSGESVFRLFSRRYAIPGLALHTTTITNIETFEINKLIPPTFMTYNVALTYHVK